MPDPVDVSDVSEAEANVDAAPVSVDATGVDATGVVATEVDALPDVDDGFASLPHAARRAMPTTVARMIREREGGERIAAM
ncbi:MAG: hypothetical protein JWN62_2139 [Acidimicrobiales bacterium]|nr:hypothetical protein [Acidimicrobiales bacterium]